MLFLICSADTKKCLEKGFNLLEELMDYSNNSDNPLVFYSKKDVFERGTVAISHEDGIKFEERYISPFNMDEVNKKITVVIYLFGIHI